MLKQVSVNGVKRCIADSLVSSARYDQIGNMLIYRIGVTRSGRLKDTIGCMVGRGQGVEAFEQAVELPDRFRDESVRRSELNRWQREFEQADNPDFIAMCDGFAKIINKYLQTLA